MSRIDGLTALILIAWLVPAAHAADKVWYPYAPNCTFPARIQLVGLGPAGPDSVSGHFEIVLRDYLGGPVPWNTVSCDFTGCPDFRIATDQMDPRLHVVCAHQTVYAITNANGVAPFTIVGGGRTPMGPPGQGNFVSITLDGVTYATAPCASFDLDGLGGLAMPDVKLWATDFFGAQNPGRSDFDHDGTVSVADLSLWAIAYFTAANTQSPAAYCP